MDSALYTLEICTAVVFGGISAATQVLTVLMATAVLGTAKLGRW